MPQPRDRDLLAKAAQLYFIEQRSQQEIADLLGATRSNVSRMLKAARELGIVEIRITHPVSRDVQLEDLLRRRFNLADSRVLAFGPSSGDPGGVLDQVGLLAAGWLSETLGDEQVLALSWGSTLHATVRSFTPDRPHDVEVVQLVGGLSAVSSNLTGQELVRDLAARLGARYRYLHAPAILESRSALAALLGEPSIAAALDAARHADIAMVGIGARGFGSSAAIIEALRLSRDEREAFESSGVVGDVCGRYYDLSGSEVRTAVRDRILAVGLDDLRAIPTVVGVAAGREKALGILGALRGRIVDVLVCDERAARTVLDYDRKE
jgi:DNA-binding transcriptional regulator LsrR (DeoR family)